MMDDNKINIKRIKEIAQELLKKIDSEADVAVLRQEDGVVAIEVKTGDPQDLIGQNGETLQAIQHLLRVMSRKIFGSSCFVDLDVNDYRKKRRDYLKGLAMLTAADVASSQKEIALSPMNSYERRIIHMELADRHDIVTESRGCDADRKIVIKPAG